MNKKILVIILLLSSLTLFSQSYQMNLEDVIRIAQEQSPDAVKAKHQFRSKYWSYKTYKRALLPQLSFNATIPSLQRAFSKYTAQDGSQSYVNQRYVSYSGNLVLNQKVGLTGGNIFISSGLQRIDNYYDTTSTKSYLSTPINIGFSQPLFNYNPYKWDKKIEPIKYNIAQKEYLEAREQIALRAIRHFFDLLAAKVRLKIVDLNVSNYDTLYQIAKGRYRLGKIAENELLQLELSLLKAKSEQERTKLSYNNTLFRFKSFLRIKDNHQVELMVPTIEDFQNIIYADALDKAQSNHPDILEYEKRVLEAQANLNRARTENGFNANLYAVFGLTQKAPELSDAYVNPNDQQQVTLGIEVPILDWGMRKGQIKMAESQLDLVKESVKQEKVDFEQSIYMKVSRYNMQQNQLTIAAKSDTVAYKSYEVTKKRYFQGKISVTDLNIAQNNMDNSKINYIRSLQKYFESYYELRQATLFDFKHQLPLSVNFEEIYR